MKIKNYSREQVRDDDIIFAAFDTETRGLGGDLLAASAHVFGKTYFWAGEFIVDNLVALMLDWRWPCVWYAHHAQYDWRYLVQFLVDQDYEIELSMRTDTDIYQIKFREKKIGKEKAKAWVVMRDSMAIFPESLAKFANTFVPELPKLEIDIVNFDPSNSEHVKYAKRDVEILAKGLPIFDQMIYKYFGVHVGHTIAGTALKAWQYTLDEIHNCSIYNEREKFIREAYFGGIVFLTRIDPVENAETYDINSSYPAVMCDYGVPGGRVLESRDYKTGKLGIYHVRVKAPDNLIIPILPSRNKRGGMQWRGGIFDTHVTSSELIFAAKHGYTILEVYSGIVFEDRIFPFNDFIGQCKSIRSKFKGLPPEKIAKTLQNSLYGKFAARRERLKIYHPKDDTECFEGVPLESLDYFWIKKEFDEEMRCRPEWSVFITAHARLRLLQAAYSVGVENVIYGDTDSLTILPGHGEVIDVGADYGQFKLEKKWRVFRALGAKLYAGVKDDGEWTGAAKGLSKKYLRENPSCWEDLHKHGHTEVEYDSLPSLRKAIETGFVPSSRRRRKSGDLGKSNNWYLKGDKVYAKIAS